VALQAAQVAREAMRRTLLEPPGSDQSTVSLCYDVMPVPQSKITRSFNMVKQAWLNPHPLLSGEQMLKLRLM